MWETHITSSDPNHGETSWHRAWHLTTDGKHAATVYDLGVMLDWLRTGRADSADMGYVYRHPQRKM
jgi:hypothetical protein